MPTHDVFPHEFRFIVNVLHKMLTSQRRVYSTLICKLLVTRTARSHFTLQVHVNGFVSLDYPLCPNNYPLLNRFLSGRRIAVIAPFWADIDLRYTDGVVYLGHVWRNSAMDVVSSRAAEVFEAARLLVVVYAGDTGFLPTEVVTVTWQNVSPYPGRRHSEQVRA